jgi:hypothetical protein
MTGLQSRGLEFSVPYRSLNWSARGDLSLLVHPDEPGCVRPGQGGRSRALPCGDLADRQVTCRCVNQVLPFGVCIPELAAYIHNQAASVGTNGEEADACHGGSLVPEM